MLIIKQILGSNGKQCDEALADVKRQALVRWLHMKNIVLFRCE